MEVDGEEDDDEDEDGEDPSPEVVAVVAARPSTRCTSVSAEWQAR